MRGNDHTPLQVHCPEQTRDSQNSKPSDERGQRTGREFLQRRPANGQQTRGKMLPVTNHWGCPPDPWNGGGGRPACTRTAEQRRDTMCRPPTWGPAHTAGGGRSCGPARAPRGRPRQHLRDSGNADGPRADASRRPAWAPALHGSSRALERPPRCEARCKGHTPRLPLCPVCRQGAPRTADWRAPGPGRGTGVAVAGTKPGWQWGDTAP